MPIRPIPCHLREPFPHLTKEQVLYVGWSLVHSEDEIQATQSPFNATRSPFNANWTPIQGRSLSQPRVNLIRSLSIQANPVPIRYQSGASPRSTFRSNINSPISKKWSIRANPSKSNANPGQSNANFMLFLRTIPALNLGTSALYGMVPSLLGGRNVRNSARSASTYGQSRTSP